MRTGVAGNGTIVRRFLKDAAQVEDVRTTAICVRERSREKGEELAREYGMKVYTDYEAFLREGDMDTVYVGLINTQHYSYAKQALLAGKLFLWEAFKLPYGSILPAVKEHVKELGPVRVVQCSYCRTGKAYEEYLAGSVRPVLDPACAGGSLYDVNVYNLHFVMSLFGVPEKVCYTANRGRNGVDTSGTAVLQYDGFLAVCTAAMDCSSDNFCMIQGEKGWLRTEGPISLRLPGCPLPGRGGDGNRLPAGEGEFKARDSGLCPPAPDGGPDALL